MGKLEKLLPNLAVCEWGDVSTERILKDLIACRRLNIPAISVSERLLPVAANVADGIRVYCLTNNAAAAAKPGVVPQLFYAAPADNAIAAFELKDIKHLDWGPIIMSHARGAGFLFLDRAGENLHRLYDFLMLAGDFSGEIQYCAGTNDIDILEDARRLVAAVRPAAVPRLRLFASGRFFQNLDNSNQNI